MTVAIVNTGIGQPPLRETALRGSLAQWANVALFGVRRRFGRSPDSGERLHQIGVRRGRVLET
jgi:hypothetical protein